MYLDSIFIQNFNQDVINHFNISKPAAMQALFQFIIENNGLEVNVRNISKITGINHITIEKYLTILESLHLIRTVNNKKHPLKIAGSRRKAYVNSTYQLNYSSSVNNMGTAIESYVLDRLTEQKHHLNFYRERQKEIDFISYHSKLALEVKYRKNISKKDLKFLTQFSEKYQLHPTVITLDQYQKSNITFQPAMFI